MNSINIVDLQEQQEKASKELIRLLNDLIEVPEICGCEERN